MKKSYYRVLTAAIALVLLLAACSTVTPPSKSVRWFSETLTYEVAADKNYSRAGVTGSVLVPFGIEEGGVYESKISVSLVDNVRINEVITDMDIWEIYIISEIKGARTVDEFKTYVGSVIPEGYWAVKGTYDSEGLEITSDVYLHLRTEISSYCKFVLDSNPTDSKRTVKGGVIIVDSHTIENDEYKAESCHIEFNDYTAEIVSIDSKSCKYKIDFKDESQYKDFERTITLSGAVVDNNALLYAVRSLDMNTLAKNGSYGFNLLDIVGGKVHAVTLYTNFAEGDKTISLMDRELERIDDALFEEDVTKSTAKVGCVINDSLSSTGGNICMYFDTTICKNAVLDHKTESLNSFREEGLPGINSKNRLMAFKQNYIVLTLIGAA